MSELPKGWVLASLGELATFTNGKAFKKDEWLETGKPIIRIQNLNNPNSSFNYADDSHEEKYLVRNGDLLVSWSASLGVYYWHGQDAWLNQHIFRVHGFRECNKSFLKYALEISIDDFYTKAHGMGMVHITKGNFESHCVPLPPLVEQNRIAQKLEDLLAQVNTLKARVNAIPALLKRFRQSILTAAVSGQLTAAWRIERGQPDMINTKLEHLIKIGPQNGLYKPSTAYGSGIKIIRIDSFYSGEITALDSLRSLEVDQKELETWGIREGDILINRVNSIEYLGKCALVRSVKEPTVFESNIMRISLNDELVLPEYLMRFLSSEVGRQKLISKAKHAVNQASINQGDVKACEVPIPSIQEQTEIVKRVEQLFAFAGQMEAKVVSAKTRIDHLTQSILAKAFRGELVPQDPNDEPASMLLERIRAKGADVPRVKGGRKASA